MYHAPFSTNSDPVGGPPFGGVPRGPGPVAGQTPYGNPFVSSAPGALDVSNDHDSQYLWQGRGRVTYTLAVKLNAGRRDDTKLQETAAGHLIFVRQDDANNLHDPHVCQTAYTLGALNFYLRSEAGRMQKENDRDSCEQLMRRWRLLGVQQTDTRNGNVYDSRQEAVVTLFIGQRVRMPDLWLSTGEVAGNADRYYLLLRRFTIKEDAATTTEQDFDMEVYEDNLRLGERAKDREARRKKLAQQAEAKRLKDIAKMLNEPTLEAKEHYWGFVPYIAKGNSAPPTHTYTGYSDTGELEWVGTAIFVGTVTDRYNSVKDRARHKGQAARCVWPTSLSTMIADTAKLPDVELYLMC